MRYTSTLIALIMAMVSSILAASSNAAPLYAEPIKLYSWNSFKSDSASHLLDTIESVAAPYQGPHASTMGSSYPHPDTNWLNGEPQMVLVEVFDYEGNFSRTFGYSLTLSCPPGSNKVSEGETAMTVRCKFPAATSGVCTGNPIDIGTGRKFETERDYVSPGGSLTVTRRYAGQEIGWDMEPGLYLSGSIAGLSRQSSTDDSYGDAHRFCLGGKEVPVTIPDSGRLKTIYKWKCSKFVSYELNPGASLLALWKGKMPVQFVVPKDVVGSEDGGVQYGTAFFEAGQGAGNQLVYIDPTFNEGAHWKYIDQNHGISYFSEKGVLVRQQPLSGGLVHFSYMEESQYVQSKSDESGRSIEYHYDNYKRLTHVTLPDENQIRYRYVTENPDTAGFRLLDRVIWPTGETVRYTYNEQEYTGSKDMPVALTGKFDSYGERVGTYTYKNRKAVTTSGAAGVGKRTVAQGYNSASVTDAIGTRRSYSFVKLDSDQLMQSGVNQPAGSGCQASYSSTQYHESGHKRSVTDFNGGTTQYDWDHNRGLLTVKVEGIARSDNTDYLSEGVALSEGVTKSHIQWHSQWPMPIRKAKPGLITSFVYDGDPDPFTNDSIADCAPGDLLVVCRRVEQATQDGNGSYGFDAELATDVPVLQWHYTYNASGRLLSAGRSSDTPEETLEYYTSTTELWGRGDLKAITNAEGQKTQYTAYNAHGYPLTVIDENGILHSYEYDARNRLKSVTKGGSTLEYEYDLNGNRKLARWPSGYTIIYHYDTAGRLTGYEDGSGARVRFELDLEGNRLAEQITSPEGEVTFIRQYGYDALSRLEQIIDSESQPSTLLYDPNGNLTGDVDALQRKTNHTYDSRDRLTISVDALGGRTEYSYDANGNLASVTDPEGLISTYDYGPFGSLTEVTSPDTGTTTHEYDAAGNRIRTTDARGVMSEYHYDGLDRLVEIRYPDQPDYNVQYHYDETVNGNHGIGRLTGLTDSSGHTAYRYDPLGQTIEKQTTVDGLTLTLQYQYDVMGQVSGVTYPSGRQVNYERDSQGQIKRLLTQGSQQDPTQTLMEEASYLPFGPVSELVSGNGLRTKLSYDLDYRLTKIEVGDADALLSRLYEYDAVNNITRIADGQDSEDEENFTYDPLDRLTDVLHPDGLLSYTYDPVGNRTELYRDGGVESYLYGTDNHRLQSRDNTQYQYDAAGNTLNNGLYTFQYSASNRLTGVENNNGFVAEYRHNALGQRVYKRVATNSSSQDNPVTLYLYNETGQLIGEYDDTGTPIREYIYREQEPLALATNNQIYYYHNDHLATPKLLTDAAQNIVWQAKHTPFGKAEIQTEQVTNNLRFPGQYFDSETGLHYNYFRDYDPETGRYLQSDPIGLEGGINTYIYVWGNPINYIDPDGLRGVYGLGNGPYSQPSAVKRASQQSGVPNQSVGEALAKSPLSHGIAGQIGTTTYGPGGWGQSGSVGVGLYFEVCDPSPQQCPADEGSPFFSEPDSYTGAWYLGGVTVKPDGSSCTMIGPTFTWPPLSPNWNIP